MKSFLIFSSMFSKKYKIFFYTILLLLFVCTTMKIVSQTPAPKIPKQEVRAIWVTTVLGLDWPKTKDVDAQKRTLLEIIRKSANAKFNTIYFQVRGRSDAMYHSHYEPWSHVLTGELGKDPGWDPLEFVLDESHKRGMEVHAWFNTFLVKSGKEKPDDSSPRHVILTHPEWMKMINGEYWLDPGIPEAREYVLKVSLDLIRSYDIDGIHFDFMRYPKMDFPDDKTWKKYRKNFTKGDWRRENINSFVRALYDSAIAIKPMLKVGSAPIGIYNAEVYKNGFRGYDEVFQDAKAWLREGKMDYIAPQVYWSLKDTFPGPDFTKITKDWIKDSYGRQVYPGIGIYKPDVYKQISAIIDTSRSLGANGQAYFRYDFTATLFDTAQIYSTIALFPPMKWKDSIPPNPPLAYKVTRETISIAKLQWSIPPPAPDGDTATWFTIYRSDKYPVDVQNGMNLYTKLYSPITFYVDSTKKLTNQRYYYAMASLDKGNNESEFVQEPVEHVPEVLAALEKLGSHWKLDSIIVNRSKGVAFVPYELQEKTNLTITVWDTSKTQKLYTTNENRNAGKNFSTINISGMKKGEYIFQLQSEQFSAQKVFVVR